MNINLTRFVRAYVALASAVCVLGAASNAGAQYAATPPLRNASSTSMHICRVRNTNSNGGLPVVAVVKLINTANGTIDCQQTFTLSQFNAGQVTCTGAAVRYCEVDAQSNSLVDGLVVNLYLADNSTTQGTPLGSVTGMRIPTLFNTSVLLTPGLTVGSSNVLECTVVNTSSSTLVVAVYMYDDSNNLLNISSGNSLAAGRGVAIAASPSYPTGVAACEGESDTSAHTKSLRVSLAVTTSGGGANSSSPVGNL